MQVNSSASTHKMLPTVADYKGPDDTGYQRSLKDRIAGTDKWNKEIYDGATAKGVDPLLLKIIMATESRGDKNIGRSPSNAIGIMQILPSWGFDAGRLETDVRYAVECAAEVIKSKVRENKGRAKAQANGGPGSVKNVARGYIGWGAGGVKYADQVAAMYEGFGYSATKSALTSNFTGGTTWSAGMTAMNEELHEQEEVVTPLGSGVAGEYSGEVFKGQNGVYDKMNYVPSHYYEDDFSQLPHRYTQGDFFVRIGDARFVIPPTQIRISESSDVEMVQSIRQKQSIKTQNGAKMKTIEMTLMFTDFDQINGYEMDAPVDDGRGIYYMDGLRSLLAQMKTMPFLPVENEYLNFGHDIYAVALMNCHVSTVEGFPGMLKADLSMLEFDPEAYLGKPAWMYDMHFSWPLFRWHYQRLLNGTTKGSDALAPFIGDDILKFAHIDERALVGQEEAVIKQYDEEMKQGERYETWWDINTKLTSEKEKNKLFREFQMAHDYQIMDISGSFGNNLTPLNATLTGKPSFQYFGSQDLRFNVVLHTTSRETILAFNALKDLVDRYAREYRNRFVSSMLRVENNFINMLGVTGVMIENISVESIEGQPGAFYIALSLISFDETQHRDESLGHLDTVDIEALLKGGTKAMVQELGGATLENFDNNIIHAAAAERLMDDMDMYPDLELPTHKKVMQMIPVINAWRKARGFDALPFTGLNRPYGAKYADPDFYFSYPSMKALLKKMSESMADADITRLAVESGMDFDGIEAIDPEDADLDKFFGGDALERIRNEVAAKTYVADYDDQGFNSFADIEAAWARARLYVTDPHNYAKNFWVKAWSGKNGEWTKTENAVRVTDKNNDDVEPWEVGYFKSQQPVAQVKAMREEDYFNGMMHDMIRYDRTGTMMRAFPTYALVLIDEGRAVNVRKLWDNYYTYHSLSEIDVHMDRKSPVHTAYIKLSNIYGTLSAKNVYHHKLRTPDWGDAVRAFYDQFVSRIKERELIERTMLHESIELLAGARIHVRMGYGSSASQLPVVFNGVIAEMDLGDTVSIVAQSFGYELTNPVGAEPNETTSMTKQGLEATELFRYYMSVRNSNHTWRWRTDADPADYQSAHGIEHFGFLRVRDEQSVMNVFDGLLHMNFEKEINAEDYDLMKNIYSTLGYAKTGVDEGVVRPGEGDITEDGDKLRGLPSDTDFRGLLPLALAQWNAPVAKAWANQPKLNMQNIKVGSHTTSSDSIIGGNYVIESSLGNLNDWPSVKKAVKAIGDKRVKKEDRRKVVEDIYRWAANPETDSYPTGSAGRKWELTANRKAHFYYDDIEKLLSDLKKVDTGLHQEAVKTVKAISDEWGAITKEIVRIQDRDMEKKKGIKEQAKELVEDVKDTGEKLFGEENVRMQLEGKSPWDIFRTLAFVNPEYIVYPHVHQFGYTLFFGKPHWNVQCGYVLPPLQSGAPKGYGQKVSDYVELSKPFSQLHFYTGYGDIIGNTVKVVGTNLTTAVIPMFAIGEEDQSYEVIWADYYIRGSFQRTLTVDSTLVQNVPYFPDWLERFGTWAFKTAMFGGPTKYEKNAARFGQSVLAESFRDMYQGEVVVFGDPSVKPYDLMYMDDYRSRLSGTAEVGSVTHHMSVHTGFITNIKPDLAVTVNPDVRMRGEEWEVNPELAPQNLMRMGSKTLALMSLRALQVASAYAVVRGLSSQHLVSRALRLARISSVAGAGSKLLTATGLRWASKNIGVVKGAVAASAKAAQKGRMIVTGLQGLRMFRTGLAAASAASAATVVGIPGAVLGMIGFFTTSILINNLELFFIQKHNNAIKIFPLFHEGRPFVAGVNGHKQLIPGWQDNGNGRSIPVGEEHSVPSLSPKTAGEILQSLRTTGSLSGGTLTNAVSGDYDGTSAPAKWMPKLDAKALKPGMFKSPIALPAGKTSFAGLKARMSSSYGFRWGAYHQGTDIKPDGANDGIYALAAGEVMMVGPASGWGNVVVIRHTFPLTGNDTYVFFSLYAHLPNGKARVSQGQRVNAGQYLAPMGETGKSKGIHLHLEVLIPKDMKQAAAWPLNDTRAYIGGGWDKDTNVRRHCTAINPSVFLEEIVAYDSSLMQYVQYSG